MQSEVTKIVVTHEFPPIPARDHDYCARREGRDEEGPYGWGTTKQEAIDNLLELEAAHE